MNLFKFVFLILCFFISLSPVFAEHRPVIRPKVGLALGGGGARGAAHIGVLRALEKENIPVDYLVGTSAGALISALYSGGLSPDEIEQNVLSGVISKVYRTNISVARVMFFHLNRFFKTFIGSPYYAGLYNDHKLRRYINQAISRNDGMIELNIPLHIIAVDLITGLPVVIKSGDVGLAVQASTAIPTLRQPIAINQQLLIDGGVLKNIPADEARKMGADIVIAVDVDGKLDTREAKDFRSFQGVITRIISLGLRAQSENVLAKADIIISPNLTSVGILDLDKESLANAIRVGEEETLKAVPKIKSLLQKKTNLLYFSSNGKKGVPSSSL